MGMKGKIVLVLFLAAAVLAVFPTFAGGGRETKRDARTAVKAAVPSTGEPRILAAYIIDDAGNKSYVEGMYLPQAAAAYFPTPFSVSSKERRLSFDRDMPYRILSKADMKAGVKVYTIETSSFAVDFKGRRYEEGRSYTFSFPRSSLGREGAAALQPAPYALERAIRISNVQEGLARLESLRYDETSGVFKVSVNIAAQSINR